MPIPKIHSIINVISLLFRHDFCIQPPKMFMKYMYCIKFGTKLIVWKYQQFITLIKNTYQKFCWSPPYMTLSSTSFELFFLQIYHIVQEYGHTSKEKNSCSFHNICFTWISDKVICRKCVKYLNRK